MKRFYLVFILVAVSLSCSRQVSTPAPIVEPTATRMTPTATPSTATSQWTATVSRAQINVRAEPDGDVIGNLRSGDTVEIIRCVENWCKVKEPVDADWTQEHGWIYKGCLNINSGLGCEAR